MKEFIDVNGRIFINTSLVSDGYYSPVSCFKQDNDTYVDLGQLLSTELWDELYNNCCFKTSKGICDSGYVVECSAEVVEVSSYTIHTIAGLFSYKFITDFHVEPHGNHLLLRVASFIPNK